MPQTVEAVKKEWARELYYATQLSQDEIAGKIGVTQKTISTWVQKGRWQRNKALVEQTPAHVVFRLQNELAEINRTIAAREPGLRYPTLSEAETRRKIIASINLYRKGVDFAATIQVMKNFTTYIETINAADMRLIIKYADEFIRMEMGSIDAIPGVPFSDIDLMPLPDGDDDAAYTTFIPAQPENIPVQNENIP